MADISTNVEEKRYTHTHTHNNDGKNARGSFVAVAKSTTITNLKMDMVVVAFFIRKFNVCVCV